MRLDSRPLPLAFRFAIQPSSINADSQLSPHVAQFARKSRLLFSAVWVSLFAVLGCSLFPAKSDTGLHSSSRPVLPPIQAAPEAIQLEVFFLERPAEDHLLTSGIWKEVDQLGAVPPETREILRENGFRVGNVSSNPPPAVQKLLGMAAEIPADTSENAKPIMGRHQFLSPGIETEIPTGIVREEFEFQLHEPANNKSITYENVRCVLRMKANRLQEGWVRIDFQPEIHHGEQQPRRSATAEEWTLRMSQKIDARYAQKFSLKMNVGELAIITATSENEGTLGNGFFCHEDAGLKKQRVLIVRVVDSGQNGTK